MSSGSNPRWRTIVGALALALAVSLGIASSAAAGNYCVGVNSGMLKFRYTTYPHYNCGAEFWHGYYIFTANSKADYAYGGLNAPNCTSVSAQAVVVKDGVLRNAARKYDTTIGNGFGPASYLSGSTSLVGTNFWLTRTGVFDEKHGMTPLC